MALLDHRRQVAKPLARQLGERGENGTRERHTFGRVREAQACSKRTQGPTLSGLVELDVHR